MLSGEDQEAVIAQMESRLEAHFDEADDFLWRCGEEAEEDGDQEGERPGEGWFMAVGDGAGLGAVSDVGGVYGRSSRSSNTTTNCNGGCNVDVRAAAAWLAGGNISGSSSHSLFAGSW